MYARAQPNRDRGAIVSATEPNGIVRGGLRVRDLATGPGSRLTATERLVALAIAFNMRQNLTAWPSARTLAGWTALSESGVRKVLKRLCGPQGIFVRTRRPGRYEGYEYSVRQGVTAGESDVRRVPPESASLTPRPARVLPRPARVSPGVNRMSKGMSEGMSTGSEGAPRAASWLSQAEGMWSERIGAPTFVRSDLPGLVSPSRPPDRILTALRAYLAQANPATARPRDFARSIERWTLRAEAPVTGHREDTPPPEHSEAKARWLELRELVKADPSLSERNYQTFAMTSRAIGLEGPRLTLWVPAEPMARFLESYVCKAAEPLGLTVALTWPGRSRVAA